MKILFLIHYYTSKYAGTRILHYLSEYILSQGIEVHILTHENNKEQNEKFAEGVIHHAIPKDGALRIVRRLLALCASNQTKYWAVLLRKFLVRFFKNNIYIDKNFLMKITELSKEHKFDVVIPFIQTGYNAVSTLEAHKKNPSIRYIPYFLDNFSTNNLEYSDEKLKVSLENEIIEKSLISVITFEMNKEFHEKKVPFQNKLLPLGFPMIIKPILVPIKDDIFFSDEKINCLFTGDLSTETRNPKFFFELFRKTQKENIVFHICGNACTRPEVLKLKEEMGNRVVLHGKISVQAATNATLRANFLINLGNNMTNMLPSKIFSYFSSGKPIINTYKTQHCPTIEYMSKYPFCLNLLEEGDGDALKNLEKFEKFCEDNKDKRVSFDVVKDLYYENTVDYVAGKMLESLETHVQ